MKISDAEFWGGDPDRFIFREIIEVLVNKTGIPLEQVIATTLAAYEGVISEKYCPYGYITWILPIGEAGGTQRRRLQFCPFCLAENEEPYYRRSWRLAFITFCVRHNTPLLDRCPHCGSAIIFHKLLISNRCNLASYSITSCHSCRDDLRNSAFKLSKLTYLASKEEVSFHELLMRALSQGWVEIDGNMQTYSHMFFAVLRRLINLFSNGRMAYALRESASRRYGLENFAVTHLSSKNQYIEFLDVDIRRRLLNISRQLFRSWPNEFIDFCQANRIWRQTLLKNFASAPFWYWSVVNEYLSYSRHKPSEEEVISAIQCMERFRQQHRNYRPYRYPKRMKAVSSFLERARRTRYRSLSKLPNMQLKSSWRSESSVIIDSEMQVNLVAGHLIPDELWATVETLLPPPPLYPGGKRRDTVDTRTLLDGMLYVLGTDTPWHKMPTQFGSHSTVYKKYAQWKKSGIFDKIWALYLDFTESVKNS